MSTENVSLPIVAGNVGAGASVLQLAACKKIVVADLVGTVTIEAKIGSAEWCPVATFSGSTLDKSVEIVADEFRVNATNGSVSAVDVIAERSASKSGDVPVPPENGAGAALDVSQFGPKTTLAISGKSGNGSVNIEASGDGVNYSVIASFQADGCKTVNCESALYLRAVGNGATAAAIGVASEDPATTGTAAQVGHKVVYRHEAASPGGNVYATWEESIAAALAAWEPGGLVGIEFDTSETSHLNGYGDPACPIPAGAWDHEEKAIWLSTPQTAPGFSANSTCRVDILDGAEITGLRAIWGPGCMTVTYDGPTPDSLKIGYLEVGCTVAFSNTDPAAGTMLARDPNALGIGGNAVIGFNPSAQYGGIGADATGRPNAVAPLINTGAPGESFIVLLQSSATLADDMASGQGRLLPLMGTLANGADPGAVGTWRFPTLAADGGFYFSFFRYAVSQKLSFNAGPVTAADSPFQLNNLKAMVYVDSSDGPVEIQLPATGFPTILLDIALWFVDIGRQSSKNPITIKAAPGEAIGDDTEWVIAEDGGTLTIAVDGGVSRIIKPLGVRAQGAQTGALPTLTAVAGMGEDGPTNAAQSGWVQQSVDGNRATGSITAVAGANLIDGETFTIDDGNGPVVFEFDSDGSVNPGNVGVAFTAGDTAATVASAIAAAISGSTLIMKASIDGGTPTVVDLVGPSATAANVAIVDTVADGGFAVTGMAGAAPGKVVWLPSWE